MIQERRRKQERERERETESDRDPVRACDQVEGSTPEGVKDSVVEKYLGRRRRSWASKTEYEREGKTECKRRCEKEGRL